MERVLLTVLIVQLASTVQVKGMRYGLVTVHADFTASAELIMPLQMIESLESFVQKGEPLLSSLFL